MKTRFEPRLPRMSSWKNFTPWIRTEDPCQSGKYLQYLVTGPPKQDTKGSHKSILVPLWTTKDSHSCRLLTGLADLFPQLGSSHQQLCGESIYLALMVQCRNTYNWCRVPRSNPGWEVYYFFMLTSLGDYVQIWFSYFLLGLYMWNLELRYG